MKKQLDSEYIVNYILKSSEQFGINSINKNNMPFVLHELMREYKHMKEQLKNIKIICNN